MHVQVHLMLCGGKMYVSHNYTMAFVHNSPCHIVSPSSSPPQKFNAIIDTCMKENQIIHHRFIQFNEREGYQSKSYQEDQASSKSTSYTTGYFHIRLCGQQCLFIEYLQLTSPARQNLHCYNDSHSRYDLLHLEQTRKSIGCLQDYRQCSH
jgi:hypothetical protein